MSGVHIALYASSLLITSLTYFFVANAFRDTSSFSPNTQTATDVSAVMAKNDANKAWSYDFSSLQDGNLPLASWNIVKGTQVALYNNEAQAYTDRTSNIRIEGGELVIEARPEKFDGQDYTSARINTKGHFSFTYGKLEVDMMIPKGKGTWVSAWLLPESGIYKPSTFGISPTDPDSWALNGEIDFAESIGSIQGQNIPASHSYNSVHRSPVVTPVHVSDPYTKFHRYGIIKTPDTITFTIDGRPYATRTRTSNSPLEWPFNQPYYLIINLAVGGDWAGVDGIDNSTAPWLLKVRSVNYVPM